MDLMTTALRGMSETLFTALSANPILVMLTIALSVVIWVLPNRLQRDAAQRPD